jgi:murein DD-endopeptidase MepM/ murein hydrolase activator NlpD
MNKKQLVERYTHDRRLGKVLNPAVAAHVIDGASTLDTYRVTTDYGIPGDMWQAGHHTGEDHACPVGSLAVAVSWGHVIAAGPAGAGYGAAYGNIVVIRTRSGRFDYMLCHLSHIMVTVGASVEPGEVVGLTGATGNVTGPHLHFEARPAGGRYGSDVRPVLVKQKGH